MGDNPFIPEYVGHFVSGVITRESSVQKRLREETLRIPQHMMQISPDEGAFLGFMVQAINANNILEIGTFTGYSALAMAMALPEGGKLIACDMSKVWTDIARRYWEEAGVAGKIEVRLGQAQETLVELQKEGKTDYFDLAFIDADKTSYDIYYESCLKLVRPGGIIAIDNMLWRGAVADPDEQDSDTQSLRALNVKLHNDLRVDISLLTVADGLMMVRKRKL